MIDQEVAARVKEFKGKPQALQEKYAASQQLIDLLALQKIKSMQEAAARQMQLQMAQQQAANGESNATIAEQREKEVMDMTKNELAQQRGELAQQQQTEQQQAMQKLMGGIASAPGAASAMEPQAMAAGGIVAFKEGDGVKDERYKRKEGESFEDFRARVLALDQADTQERLKQERNETERARLMELEKRGGAAIPPSPYGIKRDLGIASLAPQAPQAQQAPRLPVSEAQATMQAGPQAAMPPPAPMAPPPPQAGPRPPMPAAPPPQAQQGLGGLQMGPPMDTVQNAVERQTISALKTNPQADKLAEEKRIEDRLKLTPEQRAVYDEGIAGLKKFYDQDFDPEMQRREGIKRYLLGMGGRRTGEFAGGAGAAMDYDTAQRNQQRARFGEMQKSREGLIGLEREPIKSGIEGGFKTFDQSSQLLRSGLQAGTDITKTEQTARDNAAMREIEKLKIGAQNAATAAQRDANDFAKLSGHLSTITNNRARAEQAVIKSFQKNAQAIEMQLMANPKDKNALAEKAALQLEIESSIDKTTKPFDLLASTIQAKLYGGGQGGLGGFTVREKPTK